MSKKPRLTLPDRIFHKPLNPMVQIFRSEAVIENGVQGLLCSSAGKVEAVRICA